MHTYIHTPWLLSRIFEVLYRWSVTIRFSTHPDRERQQAKLQLSGPKVTNYGFWTQCHVINDVCVCCANIPILITKSSFNNDNYLPNYIWPTYVYKLSSSIWLSMGSLSFERLWSDLFILLVQCSSQRISITLKLELHEFGLNPSYDWPDKEERAPSRGEVSFYRNVIQGQKMSPS